MTELVFVPLDLAAAVGAAGGRPIWSAARLRADRGAWLGALGPGTNAEEADYAALHQAGVLGRSMTPPAAARAGRRGGAVIS